jgi:tetratricopeptide (TPR) repeat protein
MSDADRTPPVGPLETTGPYALSSVLAAGVPGRLGAYTILGVLGEGGMGVVYRAEQDRPRRPVALKVIRPDTLSPERLRRFEAEVEVLGRLQHPGIARIYEAGTTDAGRGPQPFFAMELVEGLTLHRHADDKGLGVRDRLRLLARVCEAVQHAHHKGVIHRDLKPGNILVDAHGQPKVLDFGVARVTDDMAGADGPQTQVGQLVGTIPYMSPEQASGDPDAVDTRSDVYALGVIGYELLAGRLPHDLRGLPASQAVRRVAEGEPVPLGKVDRAFRGELECVFGRALAKDKARRYASAAELAADLERYLGGEPVAARPAGALYRFRKLALRHKAAAAALALLVVALVGGSWLWAVSTVHRERADRAEWEKRRLAVENVLQQARAAGQVGRWDEALARLDEALAAGPDDPVGLRLERVRALFALNDLEAAGRDLAALDAEPDLGPHAGAVLLLRGDLALGRDNEGTRRLIERARERGLPPAEDAYAQGLLAQTVPDAVKLFRRALGLDPFHQRARLMLTVCLIVRGERDDAGVQAQVAAQLFPADPGPHLVGAALLALDGKRAEAEAEIEEVSRRCRGQSARDLCAALRPLLGLLADLRDWETLSDGQVMGLVGRCLLRVGPLAGRLLPGALGAGGADASTDARLLLHLPPLLYDAFGSLFRFVRLLQQDKDAEALDELQRLAAVNPEGMVFYLRGMLLAGKGRYREAEPALLRAAETPAMVPVRRSSLFLAVVAQWGQVRAAAPRPETALRAKAVGNIRRLLGLGPVLPAHAFLLWNIAAQARELDLARLVVADWEQQAPGDLEAKVARATVERLGGAYAKALETAEEVLKKKPDHAEALRNKRLAEQKLRELR